MAGFAICHPAICDGFPRSISETFTQTGFTAGHNEFLDLTIQDAATVPEPASAALCGVAGMLGLLIRARRRLVRT